MGGTATGRAISAAALALAAAPTLAGCARPPRPNVLLLVMDTTRADRCGFEGYARDTTPRLSEFAKDAVVFEEAWSPANWTGPAHASLFTGLGPERHGFHRPTHPYLAATRPVLAARFADAGWSTACFTNNELVSPEFGLTRGFAKFEPLYLDAARPYPWAASTHELALRWAEGEHAAGRPFFLFINDFEPHVPYAPPPEDAARFVRGDPAPAELARARAFNFPENLAYDLGLEEIDPGRLALLSDLYDAEIHALDREIGALLDRLKADGLLDTTVVAIVGDHGEYLGEHHILEHSFGLHAEVCRVPLLLRHPHWFDGGRRVRDVVRLEDVAPTLLEVCGLDPFPDADGVSLSHGLRGRIARGSQPARGWASGMAAKHFPQVDASKVSVAIRSTFDGTRHLILFGDGRAELYDPVDDPEETHDLARRVPSAVARLCATLRPPR